MLLLPIGLAAPPPPPAPVEEPSYLLAVFDEVPPTAARRRAIRYAMRKSKAISGGNDWGRALCFQFSGKADDALIAAAASKTRLPAAIREAPDCMHPPPEALIPEKPVESWAVQLDKTTSPATIRNGITHLLGVGGLGLSGVRTLDAPADVFCLDFGVEPDRSVVEFALRSLPFVVTSTRVVEHCRQAFE